MRKKYNDKFDPNDINFLPKENRYTLSNYYIEVSRECYRYEGLKNKKNDILVYSAVVTGLNNNISDVFSYTNADIGKRLAMNDREVRRAVSNLEELELIKVTHPSKNKRNIKVLVDLRYTHNGVGKGKKKGDFFKIYDRLFYYPLITKPMIHVYSHYLALTHVKDYPGFSTVSYRKVAEALGYSEKQIIDIINDMVSIGLFKKISRNNSKAISVAVDFSNKQPEESAYEEQYKQWHEQRVKDIVRQKKEEQEKERLEDIACKKKLEQKKENLEDVSVGQEKPTPTESKRIYTVDDDFEW